MKLQLDQRDEFLREKEKKLKEWVSTRGLDPGARSLLLSMSGPVNRVQCY